MSENENKQIENEYLLQFFTFGHLPPNLQEISKPFADLARMICDNLNRNPERTVALRKLLEAKDCAVRAHLFKGTSKNTTSELLFSVLLIFLFFKFYLSHFFAHFRLFCLIFEDISAF